MSVSILSWAFQQKTGSASSKLVLLTLADLARAKYNFLAFPSICELCNRTELNRKTAIKAISELITAGLIIDTADRIGRTKQIPVYAFPQEVVSVAAKSAENGTVPDEKQSQNSHETVPILPANSPVFSANSPKIGTRTRNYPSLPRKETMRSFSPRENLEIELSSLRFCLERESEPSEIRRYKAGISRVEEELAALLSGVNTKS